MAEPDRAKPEHRPLPIRRLLVMACVMAVGIAGLWMVIDRFSNVDVNDPTPPPASGSPVASPTVPASMIATPGDDGVFAPPAGSLPDLLRYAPDRLADDSLPLTDVGRYADIQAWMASRGLDAPSAPDGLAAPRDPELAVWRAELDNLALPTSLADRGLDPEWERSYGFRLTQVHQVLIVGQAPDYVMIVRGAFDPAGLHDAWVSSGYQAVEVEGTTIWTLFPGDTIDLSDTASRPAMGMLNNVVLLEDGTLVAAAKLPRLQSALRVVNGSASSLADNASIASLVGPGTGSEDLVSAVISRGSLLESLPADLPSPRAKTRGPDILSGQSFPTMVSSAVLAAQMPRVELVMIGVSLPASRVSDATPVANAPGPDPHLRLMFSFDDIDDGRIAQRVIEQRFNAYLSPVTGGAYRERFGSARVRVLDAAGDPAIVEIEASLPRGVADWLAILSERDIGFAFWLGPEASRDD